MMSTMKQIEDLSAVDVPVGGEAGRRPSALSTGRAPATAVTAPGATATPGTALPKVGPLAVSQRWSVARRRKVVLPLLRGESAELLSRELGVPIFKLEQWRQKAEAAFDGPLKERETDAASAGLAAAMQRLARSAWRSNCSAPVSSAPALWPAGGRYDCQGGLPHQRAALRHPPRLSGLGRSPLQLLRRPDAATPRRKPGATAGASWGKARHPGRGPARRHPLRSRPLALDRRRPPQGLGTSARTTAFAAPPSASCA